MSNETGTTSDSPSRYSQAKRYGAIYLACWKNSIVREMSFKANFLLWIFVEFLWFAMQLVFINVIYLHTDSIGSWTKWEVVLLMGTSHLIQQLFSALFMTNVTQLSELIREGRLDFMLMLPVNTRFLVSFRTVDLGGFINAASAIGVIAYASIKLDIVPTSAQFIGFGILCLFGIALHYSLMIMLASISFFTVRSQGIIWGYYNLFNIARLPDEAFRGLFKAFFSFAIPILLVANVPARVMLDKISSPLQILQLALLTFLAFAISDVIWRLSLRRYTSASS